MTVCYHRQHEPVELILTGEVVARICTDCLIRLPADFNGETLAVHVWGQREPIAVLPL